MYTLTGTPAGEVALPAIGTVAELNGRPDDREMFLSFTSFTYPPTVYRYDFEHADAGAVRRRRPSSRVDPTAYETEQVWYPSKDGTRVSMFVVCRKGLARDGARPVLLTGYGGFNISLTPAFDPANFAWLDRGGVYAVANLRGGGEYGEAWHEAGMLERKQNVFDDFIAAAEWLVANNYTSPEKLAIEGGSNGGLLVGAVLVQRPELFGAVVCRVPVADMLRYHLFTVGRFWIPEYGSSDDPEQFPYLYQVLPAAQREGRRGVSRDAGHDGGHRRPRVAGDGQEVRRAAPGRDRRPGAHPHSRRDQGRPRRRQARVEDDRRGRGHLRVSVQGAGGGRRPGVGVSGQGSAVREALRRRPVTASPRPPARRAVRVSIRRIWYASVSMHGWAEKGERP